jgi:hypothetical protein
VCLYACVRDGWNDLCLCEFVIMFSRVVCFYVSVTLIENGATYLHTELILPLCINYCEILAREEINFTKMMATEHFSALFYAELRQR